MDNYGLYGEFTDEVIKGDSAKIFMYDLELYGEGFWVIVDEIDENDIVYATVDNCLVGRFINNIDYGSKISFKKKHIRKLYN